ncbi:hypothetical protein M5689_015649 [Euphorbia peplus]|nr:hypothetical protein M5689_015649 [Euphorbia peplus]
MPDDEEEAAVRAKFIEDGEIVVDDVDDDEECDRGGEKGGSGDGSNKGGSTAGCAITMVDVGYFGRDSWPV